jgi:hypothetical protein
MKQPKPRTTPFIWISWLAKFIAGEIQCDYQCWFKSHFQYEKLPNDFNLIKWTTDHNQLVRKTRKKLESDGYKVLIEDQNSIKAKFVDDEAVLQATISAKPDIVAFREDENLTIDCKTGKTKNSDQIQVLLYMKYLPTLYPNKKYWDGRVVYPSRSVAVPSAMMDGSFNRLVEDSVREILSPEAHKAPSLAECRRCDICSEYCKDRINEDRD